MKDLRAIYHDFYLPPFLLHAIHLDLKEMCCFFAIIFCGFQTFLSFCLRDSPDKQALIPWNKVFWEFQISSIIAEGMKYLKICRKSVENFNCSGNNKKIINSIKEKNPCLGHEINSHVVTFFKMKNVDGNSSRSGCLAKTWSIFIIITIFSKLFAHKKILRITLISRYACHSWKGLNTNNFVNCSLRKLMRTWLTTDW